MILYHTKQGIPTNILYSPKRARLTVKGISEAKSDKLIAEGM